MIKRQKVEAACLFGPTIASCRSVDEFEKLNRIQEGSYGVVYRAKDKRSGQIVALKKLKLENEKDGFPITSIREIHTLKLCKHANIVEVLEIVTTPSLNHIFIVMEYVEHDLKSLMEDMASPFVLSEIKTMILQLLSGVAHLHKHWIIHRDLKTSNLLMNNRGSIKIADFGLARRYGSPLGDITQLVVTLWYRAPELLLGAKKYSTEIDMWSIGCIFAELIHHAPLFDGKGEIDQLAKIFQTLGSPSEDNWPGFRELPNARTVNFARQTNKIREKFRYLSDHGHDLLNGLLKYSPKERITAEDALNHPFFAENPPPKDPNLFPTFPSKSSGERRFHNKR
jgi:cell division cycle 2-like protein